MKRLLALALSLAVTSSFASPQAPLNEQTSELRALPQEQQIYACMAVYSKFVTAGARHLKQAQASGTDAERRGTKNVLEEFVNAFTALEFVYQGLDAQYERFLQARYDDGVRADAVLDHCGVVAEQAAEYALGRDEKRVLARAEELRTTTYRTHGLAEH